MSEIKVSILVNNFSGTTHLGHSLDSLLSTNYPIFEVLVMDCCTPDFEKWMNDHYPQVKYVHLETDIGAAAQRNVALKACDDSSKYICFMDDDVVVTPDWLKNIIRILEEYPRVGAAQPILYDYCDQSKIDSIGHLMTRTCYPVKINGTQEKLSELREKEFMDIFYAETAAIVVRREALRRLSKDNEPFDGDYFMHFYDVDLCWRLWLAGFRVVTVADAICYHDRGVSGGLWKLKPMSVFRNTKNRFLTMLKNHEASSLVRLFPLTLTLEIGRALVLLYYSPKHGRATFSAILWILSHPRYIHTKRVMYRNKLTEPDIAFKRVFMNTNLFRLIQELQRHYEH